MSDDFFSLLKFKIFNTFQTGNIFVDSIITTLLFSVATIIFTQIEKEVGPIINTFKTSDWYPQYKTSIYYEGLIVSTTNNSYDVCIKNSNDFSDTLLAFVDLIYNNQHLLIDIKELKETCCYNTENDGDVKSDKMPFYLVKQSAPFLIDKERTIYCKIESREKEISEKDVKTNKKESIRLTIFSCKINMNELLAFSCMIRNNYLNKIKKYRNCKLFIYTLIKSKWENSRFECWDETEFLSNRNFDNYHFHGKESFLKQLHFFQYNKDWYDKRGIPYTLGIGLHGPPGTGKTSLIKSLANHLGRNLVVLSFKVIKTRKMLMDFFYEVKYCRENEEIGFNSKILVFEDLDCLDSIVKERLPDSISSVSIKPPTIPIQSNQTTPMSPEALSYYYNTDNITLDDILNIFDGIRECPGRIIIITSNQYDKLDAALIRPGRIDITLELGYLLNDDLAKIYSTFYDEPFPLEKYNLLNESIFTAAEITNIYLSGFQQDSEGFINTLIKHPKNNSLHRTS
jgi:DNA replication protein DnaC